MKTLILLFVVLCAATIGSSAQSSKHNLVDVKIKLDKPSPFTGNTVQLTIEVIPLKPIKVKEGKVYFNTSDNISFKGSKEFSLNNFNFINQTTFTTQVTLTSESNAELTAIFEYTTDEGRQGGEAAFLYFLPDANRTFYAPNGLLEAKMHRLKYLKIYENLSEKAYNQAIQDLLTTPPIPVQSTTDSVSEKKEQQKAQKKNTDAAAASTIVISGIVRWTDRNGIKHPIKFVPVEIWDEDIRLHDLLTTVYTDDKGFYSATIESQLTDNPDIYLKVFSKSDPTHNYCYVVPVGGRNDEKFSYIVQTNVMPDITTNTTITFDIPNVDVNGVQAITDSYNAFSVYSAIVEGALYVQKLEGKAPAKIAVEFANTTGSEFDPTSIYLSIQRTDRFDWDIIHHEYGHYIASLFKIDDPTAVGPHWVEDNLAEPGNLANKEKGFNLAWSEGWPSYFAISLQEVQGIDIPGVGAAKGNRTLFEQKDQIPSSQNYDYNLETNVPYASKGEDQELAVQRILWDLFDTNADGEDKVSLGGVPIWQAIKSSQSKRLYDTWQGLIKGRSLKEQTDYGSTFAEHKVASLPTNPKDGDKITDLTKKQTFTWDANGAGPSYLHDDFIVEFYDKTLTTLLYDIKSKTSTVDVPPDGLKKIFNTNSEVKWIVKSSNTKPPTTGPYVSPAFTLNGPPQAVNVVFVIDDTGSMGEEINSVKNSITKHLDTYVDDGSTVFQLVTYKDNVSIREPTSDLALIRSQVASLVASGGFDCPEGSVEALEAIKDGIADNGVIFHATDADPRPGTNFNTVIASLKPRGITVSTLLSGNCSGVAVASADGKLNNIAFSDNKDSHKDSTATSAIGLASDLSAIEAFSMLARETGGLFAYVPEVNSGNPSDIQRYENIAYNVIQGGLSLSVTSIDPSIGPKGGELVVTINGSKTNFNDSTTVAFSTGDIIVSNVDVLSATRLQATLTISDTVTLGFKNVVVTTPLGEDSTEVAEGEGVFQVIETPISPTILSITPTSGAVGQQVEVTISAINTNFTDSSQVNLGSGITVLKVEALTDEALKATLQISDSALPGFRSVIVTTGTEVATEDVPGPFLITSPDEDSLQTIVKIALVNADTDREILEIKDGQTIDLISLPTQNLNIRAYTDPDKVGSVLFNLDGNTIVENFSPYLIGGDAGGNYRPWTLPVGEHTLRVTPYTESTPYGDTLGKGGQGIPLTVKFTVTGWAVSSLILVNADTDEDIQTLKNGDVIDLSTLPTYKLNIRAVTNPEKVGSVVFNLNNKTIVRENHFPYAIGGDISGDFRPWFLPVDNHTLTATPYQFMGAGGKKGAPQTLIFTVIDNAPMARFDFSNSDRATSAIVAAPNPFGERTTIRFSVGETSYATLDVYDPKGITVVNLFKGETEVGKTYSAELVRGKLSSGVYIARLATSQKVEYYKLVITR